MRRVVSLLAATEIWVVAIAILMGIVSERFLILAVVSTIIYFPLHYVHRKQWIRRTPADLAILLMLLMSVVTLLITALPETTRPQVFRLWGGIVFFYAIVNWTLNYSRWRLLVNGFIVAGLVLCLYGLLGTNWAVNKLPIIPEEIYQKLPAILSDTIHPNVLAGNLVFFAPIMLCWLLLGHRLRWYEIGITLFSGLVMVGVVLITQSRSAVMALLVSVLIIPALFWRRGWIVSLIALIGGMIGIYIIGVARVLNSLMITSSAASGLNLRMEIWSRAIFMIQDFSFTGVGMGLFGHVVDLLYPLFSATPGNVKHAHNLFLQIAIDLGIPGLIAWLAVCFVMLASAFSVYRQGVLKNIVWAKAIGVGLLASQAAFLLHGLFDAVTWGMIRPAPLIWGLWGLTIASYKLFAESPRRGQPSQPIPTERETATDAI